MATIGKVTVGATTHQIISVKQSQQTSIANPNLELPKPSINVADLQDITTANVQDGYTLIYNSHTEKYEASPISGIDIVLDSVAGGTF